MEKIAKINMNIEIYYHTQKKSSKMDIGFERKMQLKTDQTLLLGI